MRLNRWHDSLAALLLIFGMLASRSGSWWVGVLAGLAIFFAVQMIIVSAAQIATQVVGRMLLTALEPEVEEKP